MADNNINRNINDEKEYLALQEQIRNAQRDAGKSLASAGKYTGVILANYREMQKVSSRIKDLNKEINKLEKEETDEARERAKILRQNVQELEKERDQIKAINKEMASLGGVVRMGLSGLVSYLGQALTGYLEFSQKTRDVAAQIGLGSNNMNMLQSNIQQAAVQMNRYGVNVNDALEAQQAYSDELGRAVILSQSALENMSEIGKATGLGMQGMAGLTAQMEQFGLGAEDSAKMIYTMYSDSTAMGLNAGKVIKKFEQNIGLLNRLNFKNGIKGLQKMAQLSEKYKINMDGIAAASEKAFSIEGAIDMAAQLQVMGGAMAGLGDPFQLMYKARNNPEKFAEDMAQAAAQSAVFNSQSGEFEVSAMEMDRLRIVAEATGQQMSDLVGMAKRTAKVNMFKGLLGGKGLTPEEQDAVAMMTDMVDGKAKIQIGPGKDDVKELSALNADQLRTVLNEKKNAKEAASQATGIMERLQNFLNQLMVAVYPLFHTLEQYLQPLVDMLTEKTTGWAESLKNFFTNFDFSGFIDGIKNFFVGLWEKLKWIAEHWKLALGIAATAFVGYWLASQIAAGAIFGRTAGASFRATSGMGVGGGGGTGGMTGAQTAMQGQAAKATGMGNMMQSLGSAAKILAIAGALWILSEALINFNQVEWSSLVKGGIAMIGFGLALEFLEPALMGLNAVGWQASLVMLALGASILMLSGGLFLMGQVPLANLVVGLLGLIGVLFTFSLLAPVLAVGELVLLGLGAAFLMIGVAIAIASLGFSVLVDSFTDMFKIIGNNGVSLVLAGAGFLIMAAGIGALSLAMLALAGTSLLALPGLLMLGGVTSMLTETATALKATGGGEGIAKAVDAINKVDQDKLDALKELSMFMALLGASPTIKFDESLKIDGSIEIAGQAGGKTSTDWVNDPIFVSKLKQLISESTEKDRRGGK